MNEINIWSPMEGNKRSIVTLGKFDGVHRGHQKLIREMLKDKNDDLVSVIFIIDASRHLLYTKEERKVQLEDMGIDYLAEAPLDQKMMHMDPIEFVEKILVKNLRAREVIVGTDYRFGYQRKGTTDLLIELGKKYDFQVKIVEHEMYGKRKISSTLVREHLNEGNMEKVQEFLNKPFYTTGVIIHGRGLGHKKLLPTTNIRPMQEKLMPPNGVYVTISDFGDKMFGGITNVGYKPTVGGEDFLGVETFLFSCNEDLYGRVCSVYFLSFIRPERTFASLELLLKQLNMDIETGKNFLNQHPEWKLSYKIENR